MSTTILQEDRPTITAAGDVGSRCPDELLAKYTEMLGAGRGDHRVHGGRGDGRLGGGHDGGHLGDLVLADGLGNGRGREERVGRGVV